MISRSDQVWPILSFVLTFIMLIATGSLIFHVMLYTYTKAGLAYGL